MTTHSKKTMHRMLHFLAIAFITETALAQGLVNFQNNSSHLVSTGPNGQLMSGPAGSYYFALLSDLQYNVKDPNDPLNYTFTGLYATNSATAGLFGGGASVAVPGVPAGSGFFYEIAGWSADLGHDWNPAWLRGTFTTGSQQSLFGVSPTGSIVAGTSLPYDLLPAVTIRGSPLLFKLSLHCHRFPSQPPLRSRLSQRWWCSIGGASCSQNRIENNDTGRTKPCSGCEPAVYARCSSSVSGGWLSPLMVIVRPRCRL